VGGVLRRPLRKGHAQIFGVMGLSLLLAATQGCATGLRQTRALYVQRQPDPGIHGRHRSLRQGDDLGFKTSPSFARGPAGITCSDLQGYGLRGTREGKPFVLHSCGTCKRCTRT